MAENKETPMYRHDCERCVFLGRHDGTGPWSDERFDLYVHPRVHLEHGTELVARYGARGSEYVAERVPELIERLSGATAYRDSPLAEAYRRAVERGLLV